MHIYSRATTENAAPHKLPNKGMQFVHPKTATLISRPNLEPVKKMSVKHRVPNLPMHFDFVFMWVKFPFTTQNILSLQ